MDITTDNMWTGANLQNATDPSLNGTSGYHDNEQANRGPITWDDATWILTSSFIIFTMQSGFGLLEAGSVSAKNEVNIMVKNAVDVVFGGLSYWMFGYGLSFGSGEWSNAFCGIGDFFVDSTDTSDMGIVYSNFIFQLSFATTATTIVSGAMAERTKLVPYIVFSFFNIIGYSIPAHWIWDPTGFLNVMGVIDVAGSGGVHLLGGTAALVAALMLKPRLGRYDDKEPATVTNQTNCMIGMFMLWWGWLGFNCGSTFGISGGKWKLAAKSAVTTLNASMGGGAVGAIYSYIMNKRKFLIPDLVNSILGALVGITAGCAVMRPWEAIVVGAVGGLFSILAVPLLNRLKVDDPVGAVAVHGVAGIWGMLSVGLFVEQDPIEDLTRGRMGLLKGGGWALLGVQALACVCIIAWSGATTYLILLGLQLTIGLRMSEEDERLGADFTEHNIGDDQTLVATNAPSDPDGTVPRRRRSSFGLRRENSTRSQRSLKLTSNEHSVENGLTPKMIIPSEKHMLEQVSLDPGVTVYNVPQETDRVTEKDKPPNGTTPGDTYTKRSTFGVKRPYSPMPRVKIFTADNQDDAENEEATGESTKAHYELEAKQNRKNSKDDNTPNMNAGNGVMSSNYSISSGIKNENSNQNEIVVHKDSDEALNPQDNITQNGELSGTESERAI